MEVSALYIYPIKSLRGISLRNAHLTAQGLSYDRRFMLREVKEDGTRRNMACYHDPRMVRFTMELAALDGTEHAAEAQPAAIKVTNLLDTTLKQRSLVVTLEPDTRQLEETAINMHGSSTTGYIMDQSYNRWFSDCFGMPVELIYVGANRREVLGNLSPNVRVDSKGNGPSSHGPRPGQDHSQKGNHKQGLGLSDVAAVLVVSETSLKHVTRRLPERVEADMTKFRPNIVVSGAENEFAEDYWNEMTIQENKVFLTQNCNRCVSLNLDYDSGEFAAGPTGNVLANLSKDRRVDPGAKYSPIFGRYGFLHQRRMAVPSRLEI